MEPSLYDGDLLLVTKSRRAPRRGQIAILRMRSGYGPRWQVKRIVGLPGEKLTFEDGLLFINGIRHREPYLHGLPANLGLHKTSFEVEEGHYFVLGDNRAHSEDSRSFGATSASRIVGIVATRLWPLFRRT